MCKFFLNQENQDLYFAKGEEYRRVMGMTDDLCLKFEDIKITKKDTKFSNFELDVNTKGDDGQGDRLNNKKKVK